MSSLRNLSSVSLLLLIISTTAMAQPDAASMQLHVYAIGKTVAELPADEDFSSPQRAYATIHRRLAAGKDDWREMSVARLVPVLPKPRPRTSPPSERAARGWLDAKIIEVRMVSDHIAYVLAQWPQSGSIDVRGFELEHGRWLSASNNQADNLEAARSFVSGVMAPRLSLSGYKERKAAPQTSLDPLVNFLRQSASEPSQFLADSIARHQLVVIAQAPHRMTYNQLLCSAIQNPSFNQHLATLYLPMPANLQPRVDQFLKSDALNLRLGVEVLRDADWMGNPDQGTLDLLTAIWTANRSLPVERRIRVVFVGEPQDWTTIREAKDVVSASTSASETIAARVLSDLSASAQPQRHGLLLIDAIDAPKNLRWREDGASIKTTGWHLAQALHQKCYVILEHRPQMSSRGAVMGRTRRGLFDAAFRATDFKPVAFPLSQNPFGGEAFDGIADWDSAGQYQDGFDAYLFLEKLEDERHAPLIDGFYTDPVVAEVQRRHQIVNGFPLAEVVGVEELNAGNFTRWLNRTWGQPRDWRDHLGSIDAWQSGVEEMMQ